MGEVDHLHLVELVLANQALGVLAVRAGFGPEAGRMGAEPDRQLRFVDDLACVDVGQGNLGRGDQEIIRVVELEQVFLEFGQLARAGHGLAVDDERRDDLGVAMQGCLRVEHQLGQGAFQTGAPAIADGKAGACQLGGALEVQAAQLRAQFPMFPGREIEFRFFPPVAQDRVVLLGGAKGH